jgi:hypothetical protein
MASKGKKTQNKVAYGSRPGVPYSRAPMSPMGGAYCGGAQRPALDKKRANNKRNKKKGRKDPNSVYRREKEKRIRRGRDYFFVMRKFVCFLMFLLFALCIALFAVGYLNLFPQYTSLYVEPDYTPKDQRVQEEIDGELVDYVDQSQHFTTVDPIFGLLKKIPLPFLQNLGASPKYTQMAAKAEGGNTDLIPSIALEYFPVALLLFIIVALINMFKAFFALFGRRIYRLFGLSAIFMIIFAVITAIAGVALNMPAEQASLDFAKIVPFFTDYLLKPAEGGGTNAAGFALLAMIALPVIILILSLFAKKKVPFSIFD